MRLLWEFNIHKYKFLLSSICDAFWHQILYSVYLKVDCFQSWACCGDNEHAGETVWIRNIKFISLLPDAASAWSKRIVMSSGLRYGDMEIFRPVQNKLGLRRPSTNCLGAKHRCTGKRGSHAECNGQRDLSSHTHRHTPNHQCLVQGGFCIMAVASHKCVRPPSF